MEAGHWLDGFLGEAGQILLYDGVLVGLIDAWLCGLGEEEFTGLLPMLRRAFSGFDRSERRRLLDSLRQPKPAAVQGDMGRPALAASVQLGTAAFEAALPLLLAILGVGEKEQAT